MENTFQLFSFFSFLFILVCIYCFTVFTKILLAFWIFSSDGKNYSGHLKWSLKHEKPLLN